jgi:hypothetical protein
MGIKIVSAIEEIVMSDWVSNRVVRAFYADFYVVCDVLKFGFWFLILQVDDIFDSNFRVRR